MVEKVLGVLEDYKLNNSLQCQDMLSKENKIISCNKRGMDSKERDIILPCTNH